MVVILIVPPPPLDNAGLTGGGNSTRSASTTSVSFVSSDNGSPSYYTCCFLPQVDPDNVIATTKEGKPFKFLLIYINIYVTPSLFPESRPPVRIDRVGPSLIRAASLFALL